jgi:DNA replication protein DnaC
MNCARHAGGFDELLPATQATAAVDRFMHQAHVVVTEGDSYRFAQARDGKGVTPLT